MKVDHMIRCDTAGGANAAGRLNVEMLIRDGRFALCAVCSADTDLRWTLSSCAHAGLNLRFDWEPEYVICSHIHDPESVQQQQGGPKPERPAEQQLSNVLSMLEKPLTESVSPAWTSQPKAEDEAGCTCKQGAVVSSRISYGLSFVKSGLPSGSECLCRSASTPAACSESPWGSQIRGPHERFQRADLAHGPRVGERRREVQK